VQEQQSLKGYGLEASGSFLAIWLEAAQLILAMAVNLW
jgi:hypothetical protein